MIKIQRGDRPPSLDKAAGEFHRKDYSKDDVKQELKKMQHGKCCYCERDLRDLDPSEWEIDHYYPHSKIINPDGTPNWDEANRWENLLYACRACNGKKKDHVPFDRNSGEIYILDPTSDSLDPEDHVTFDPDGLCPLYIAKDNSQIGKSTITKLKLDIRTDVHRRLRETASQLYKMFAELATAIEQDYQDRIDAMLKELGREMSASKPFAGFARCYVRATLSDFNQNALPKLNQLTGTNRQPVSIQFPTGAKTVD